MRFASLGSGSEGNCLVVEADSTCVLLDCGFGVQEAEARLARLDVEPSKLGGILVSHEHGDHIRGVAHFSRKYRIPIWLTHGTLNSLDRSCFEELIYHPIQPDSQVTIGALEVQPFPVPHDAREPVQFVLSDGARRLGVLTDTGASTPHIEVTLSGCDALILECNHDLELLLRGPYPPSLKERIASRFGHLDNAAAARLVTSLDCTRLQHLVAAHLSRQNNTPKLARAALSAALGCSEEWIGIADQDSGFGWRSLT